MSPQNGLYTVYTTFLFTFGFSRKFIEILPVLLMTIVVTAVTINDVPIVGVTTIQTVVGVRGGGWLKKKKIKFIRMSTFILLCRNLILDCDILFLSGPNSDH